MDVETPMLTKSTPEGARDFLVPSRLQRGQVYALPQSPQQFKQLLMVAGYDRYYQIVRCFRDEDLRADRHWEFTQLDLEMSFATEEDVFEVVESMFAAPVRRRAGRRPPVPFPRLTYEESMRRFGSDKPDTRYGMELADLTDTFRGSGFRAFARAVEEGGIVKAIAAPGAASWSRRELDALVTEAKARGAAAWCGWRSCPARSRSPVQQHLSEDEVAAIGGATGAGEGDLVLIVADQPSRVHVALDGLRRLLADRLGLIPEGRWDFLWITEPPMFEWSEEEGRWTAAHHPFTMPASSDLDPATARARAYDIVLNGFELASGSIRIHDADLQSRVFDVLGISARGGPGEVRSHAGRVPVRRAAARRDRPGPGPHRHAPGRSGQHPRRDRLPEDGLGYRAPDRGAVAPLAGPARPARDALRGGPEARGRPRLGPIGRPGPGRPIPARSLVVGRQASGRFGRWIGESAAPVA